ncbi:GIY-YIG nuclease family protein [Novosphingobium sp. M1R2S20]|uniref:GIY-YIG nuclease family protein n=1 Tax=Novosphingobium rhizovicinum TaxID=3228928 RepID=A0ABV3RCW4_9SPHN
MTNEPPLSPEASVSLKKAAPTARELAAMPDYLRAFELRRWANRPEWGSPPSQEEIEAEETALVLEGYVVLQEKLSKSRVYFIQAASGPIKIGVSGNPQSRLKNLQVGSAEKLTLLATVPGGRFTEEQIHQRLIAHRLHGEWFSPHAEVLRVIDRLSTTTERTA